MNYFTYDYFDPPSAADYWKSANASDIPENIKKIGNALTRKFGTIQCNHWEVSDYIGGIQVTNGRCCIFRVCNGGRDRYGRSERWVLLAAEDETREWSAIDILDALNSSFFSQYTAKIVPSPAPMPSVPPVWESRPFHVENPLPIEDQILSGDGVESQIREVSFSMTTQKEVNAILFIKKEVSQYTAWFEREKTISSANPDLPQSSEKEGGTKKEKNDHGKLEFLKNTINKRRSLLLFLLGFLLGSLFGYFVRKYNLDKPTIQMIETFKSSNSGISSESEESKADWISKPFTK